jgi:hypothetical protein
VSFGVPLVSRCSLLYAVLCPLFYCGAPPVYLIAPPYGFLIYPIFTYQKKKSSFIVFKTSIIPFPP